MLILNDTRAKLAELILSATQAENLERVIALLSMLKILSETEDYETITKANTFYRSDEYETERLNVVCDYTLTNYSRVITLEQISAISNLTVTSFCRYFKLMTKKTYYDFLTEIRLSHACRYLIEDKIPIAHIADKCGFNNISNFYRQFKKVIGITPLSYKRKYLSDY